MTIWKYPLPIEDIVELEVPRGARFLAVQVQGGDAPENVCVWALVDPSQPLEPRRLRVVGTGHPIPDPGTLRYLDTFQVLGGSFVGHVFEVA